MTSLHCNDQLLNLHKALYSAPWTRMQRFDIGDNIAVVNKPLSH